eukprot:RCo011411
MQSSTVDVTESVVGCLQAESPSPEPQEPSKPPVVSERRLRTPIWSLFVALSTVSLVVVGVVVYFVTRDGSVAAIDTVGESYRTLACTVVENGVVNLISSMMGMTRMLLYYSSQINFRTWEPGHPYVEDMRSKLWIMRSTAMEGITGIEIGHSNGELLKIDSNPTNGGLYYGLNGNLTNYYYGYFPCTPPGNLSMGLTSDSNWLTYFNQFASGTTKFNASVRVWYTGAVALTSASNPVAIAPVYSAAVPGPQNVLALPVVGALRDSTGFPISVSNTETQIPYFDSFLKKVSTSTFPGTVVFLVEIGSGFLLASSVVGQELTTTSYNAAG